MKMQEQLAAWTEGAVAVMCIGNPLRGDDAAGSSVARQIRNWPGVYVVDARDVPEDYVSLVASLRPDTIVLIDAVDMGSEPGSVALLRQEEFTDYWPSTHRMPIGLLMSVLDRETDARVFAIGIQPACMELLAPMSGAVAISVAHVAAVLNHVFSEDRPAARAAAGAFWRGETSA